MVYKKYGVTEDGYFVLKGYYDEWGRNVIDGLLFDGTKVSIVLVGLRDSSIGSESVFSSSSINVKDVGDGSEVISSSTFIHIYDSALGDDKSSAMASVSMIDSGAGSDIANLFVSVPVTELSSGAERTSIVRSRFEKFIKKIVSRFEV